MLSSATVLSKRLVTPESSAITCVFIPGPNLAKPSLPTNKMFAKRFLTRWTGGWTNSLLRNTRKTGTASSAPPKGRASF